MAKRNQAVQSGFCSQCGTPITGDSRFCPTCGAPVDAETGKPSRKEKGKAAKAEKKNKKAKGGKRGKFQADIGDAYGEYPKINPNANWFGNFAYCIKNSKQTFVVALILIVLICLLMMLDFKLPGGKMAMGSGNSVNKIEQQKVVSEEIPADEEESTADTDAKDIASEEENSAEPEEVQETTIEGSEEETAEVVSAVNAAAIESVTASSYLSEPQYNIVHAPENLFSGTLSDNWCEDASGQGIGEYVTINLNGTYLVSGFEIYTGLQETEDLYEKNSRPRELTVVFSDGSSERISLEDTMGAQRVDFETPKATTSLQLIIEAVYEGYKYDDTVISELSLF